MIAADFEGPWLITAIHMVEAADAKADWESFWSSLTFELREPALTR